ncbi:MAG: hypothetical protein QM757_19150 [Paludibaculum sp.]
MLAENVLLFHWSDDLVAHRMRQVREYVLGQSRHLNREDFHVVHPRDLHLLFEAYDRFFFEGLCSHALGRQSLSFRLSSRMTKAGGKTTRFTSRAGVVSYEISIAVSMLFDSFEKDSRSVTVCGIDCANRFAGLQRVFEHELTHLIEMLCWGESDCSAARFQGITARYFRHTAHTHNLITRREQAAEVGIRVGSMVGFTFEGRSYQGRVNRVTKRVTVLVEDMAGQLFSDGKRYRVFYVPIGALILREPR